MKICARKKFLLPILWLHIVFLVFSVAVPYAAAQAIPPTAPDNTGVFGSAGPSDIVNTFYQGTQTWIDALRTPARELFWALAGIDLTWTCITLVLQHQELYPWLGGFIRKLLTIGFFATLLENGATWIAAVVNFFINLGATAGGRSVADLSAARIMVSGIQLAGHMLHSASGAAATQASTNPISLLIAGPSSFGSTIAMILGALLMVIAYVVIALHFVMAMVEAYVTVGAGYIFLGFGGSRWTLPYTEKYIGMIVSVGVRIMVLELLIGLGNTLYTQWDKMAQQISAVPDIMDGGTVSGQWSGIEMEFALVSSILIYALLCWLIPKIASNVVSGGLSMSGGDVIGASAAGASAGATAASFASGSTASSSKAVAEVAQAAAMTGAQMGVQLAASAMTGGGSVAATSAASGVSRAEGLRVASGVGNASGVAPDGFTPLPPDIGKPEGSNSSFPGNDQTGAAPSSIPKISVTAGQDTADSVVMPSNIATQDAASSSGTVRQATDTLRAVIGEGERVIRSLPESQGYAGGTTPRMDHGE